ncbi:MAG: hypothetical protein KME45_04105 [Stenomitos rutilans HA7619-LM2]|jgi:hypothetical protein|nr:hypothetical protein [Stenomitos rutilans HA7619-LM2]
MFITVAIAFTLLPATFAQPSKANLPRSARVQIIVGKGKVRVQRDDPPNSFFARQGAELNRGDLLTPDQGVQVTILCPNGLQRSVKAVSGLGKVCPVWRTNAPRGTQDFNAEGGLDASIPYLITPRHSLLLSAKPLLRWHMVADASNYRVEVSSPTGTVGQAQTKDTQIAYAGKPLEPGLVYTLVVMTNTDRSSREDTTPSGELAQALDFRVLRPAEATDVQIITAKLLRGKPINETTALMLATYYDDYVLPANAIAAYELTPDNYQTYSLSAEAIAVLETQLQKEPRSSVLYRTLGDLYWQTGLIRLAGNAYNTAIAQMQSPEDLEEWTLAYYGLGQVYATLKDSQQLLYCLSQARIGFLFLGNPDQAAKLKRQIDLVMPKRPI